MTFPVTVTRGKPLWGTVLARNEAGVYSAPKRYLCSIASDEPGDARKVDISITIPIGSEVWTPRICVYWGPEGFGSGMYGAPYSSSTFISEVLRIATTEFEVCWWQVITNV